MTTPNTTFQRAVASHNNQVASGVVGAAAALLGETLQTGGTWVCNGSTPVTVTDSNVTAQSAIVITLKTVGGTVGAVPAIQTITVGTGFTIAGTASDTSTYNYLIIG